MAEHLEGKIRNPLVARGYAVEIANMKNLFTSARVVF